MYHLSLDPYYLVYHTQIHLDIHMHSELNALVILGLINIIPDSVQPSPVIFCGLQPLFCSFSIPLTSSTLWYDEKIINDKNNFSPVQHYWGNSCSPQEHCGDPWSWGRYWHFCPGCHTSWRVWGGFDAGVVPLEETSRGFPWLKKITSQLMIFSTSFIAKNLKKE